MKLNLLLPVLLIFINFSYAQSAYDIVKKSDDKIRGTSSFAIIKIKAIRPSWSKEMTIKAWSRNTKYSVALVVSPAKEKGIVFLRRDKEVWNYMPSIERTIKLPPSMMTQGWMGTDLTNDDMIKQSSILVDYTHKIVAEEKIDNHDTWKIKLTPKENAAVVWGKIFLWIDKTNFNQLKGEYYDEDNFLINTIIASKIKDFDGKKLPSHMEFIPEEKEGNKTVIDYLEWKFGMKIPEKYFTTAYMKRLR
jgi:outer membrane lipoprotein-sorting protein